MIDTENRGLLRTIKVPFDIKAIFLGGVGYLIFIAGGWILNEIYKVPDALSGFFRAGLEACSIPLRQIPLIGDEISGVLTSLYGAGTPALTWVEMLIAGIWFFLVLLAVYPVTFLLSTPRRRRRQRMEQGLCVRCGYDLRGSESSRCPECGDEAKR